MIYTLLNSLDIELNSATSVVEIDFMNHDYAEVRYAEVAISLGENFLLLCFLLPLDRKNKLQNIECVVMRLQCCMVSKTKNILLFTHLTFIFFTGEHCVFDLVELGPIDWFEL